MQNSLTAAQSVVVLGANSEIAVAWLHTLDAKRLRHVRLAGRDTAAMEKTAAWLREQGAQGVSVAVLDAADLESHPAFVERIFAGQEDIDLVLFAFGVLANAASEEMRLDLALETVAVNYTGTLSLALPIAAKMQAQGHGRMVLLSSVAAQRGRATNFIYASTKAGADAFFQGLGDRLQGTGVDILVVRPGFVRTKMTRGMKPLPFATTPEKVAADINAGLRVRATTIWSPPLLRWVMLVLRSLPRSIYRRLA